MIMRKVLLLLLLCSLPGVMVSAQEKKLPIHEFETLLVTPTGSEKEAFDTSLPVNLITQEELESAIVLSLPELFENEPGVDSVTIGTGSVHPMIRGLFGERVLTLVDNIRLSEQRPGGNHVFSLDPAQIERVEIVRGPASVLYGSDAIGGVMNFNTKKGFDDHDAAFRYSLDTTVQYESVSEALKESFHARFGQNRFNGYIGGSHKDAENIETPDGELPKSFYDGYSLWGGGNYVGDNWKALLDYSFMEADIGIPGPDAFAEDFFDDEKHHRVRMKLFSEPGNGAIESYSLEFGWQRHNRNRYRRKTDAIPPVLAGDLEVNIRLDIDTTTMKPQIIFSPNDVHKITAGMDMFYEDATSSRTIVDTGSGWTNPAFHNVPVIPNATRKGFGIYAQDEIAFSDKWVVTPGLRADWIKAETDGHPDHGISDDASSENTAISGNLGVLYKVSNALNLYGNFGRAFRAPTLLELYFFGPHDVGNDTGNPDLDAETSWNVDVGVKAKTERLNVMASVFYNIIDDYIVKEDQGGKQFVFKNFSEVNLYGFEAGVDYALGNGFSVFSTIAHVIGENEEADEDLPSMPPLKLRYGVRFEKDVSEANSFWAEVSALTAADQNEVAPNERETDGYTTADLRFGVNMGQTWQITAAVENILDESYQNHLSPAWQDLRIQDQPGRNVKLMLKASF